MIKLIDITESKKRGTYAGFRFNTNTKKIIKKYIEENKIPNPLAIDNIHSTLLYSRKYLPDYEPIGKMNEIWEGIPLHFSIFKSSPDDNGNRSNCLVLEYKCKEQSERFDKLIKAHDATFDFDEYNPHITLSYDVGDLEHKKLPKFENPLEIVEEYGEDLDLDWANGVK